MKTAEVVFDRSTSSIPMLADCVAHVQQAVKRSDEQELRSALIDLAAESLILACQPELLPSPLRQRQRVAVERDSSGRMN